MNFFKKLFRKDESSIPTHTQSVRGIDPIVTQAVKNLFPDVDVQKSALKLILEISNDRKGIADPKTLLALLRYSKGDIDAFRKAAWQSHPHFWMDEISPIFRTMKDAEEWVKSITKT